MIRPYYASKISGEIMHAMALKTTSVTTVYDGLSCHERQAITK